MHKKKPTHGRLKYHDANNALLKKQTHIAKGKNELSETTF